ncbi:MAG: 30S ribosomal protein S17 [Candidatus Paceibacterota bacterium]
MKVGDEKKKKTFKGNVVSNKMKDTVVVLVNRYVKHPKYKKYFKQSKKYKADDKGNKANEGDVVLIQECRPISKDKSFKVIEVVSKGKAGLEKDETIE